MIKKLLKKTGLSEIEILKSPLFIGILLLKLTFSFFAASEYLSGMFAKFINYYVVSGFQNPYDFFYSLVCSLKNSIQLVNQLILNLRKHSHTVS